MEEEKKNLSRNPILEEKVTEKEIITERDPIDLNIGAQSNDDTNGMANTGNKLIPLLPNHQNTKTSV